MADKIAFCGLVCSDCPAFIATRTNDDDLRKKTSEEWSKAYGSEIKPEDINCDGCTVVNGKHIGYCGVCEIRKCGLGKRVENCASCGDYACEKLTKFFGMAPKAKENLEKLRESSR